MGPLRSVLHMNFVILIDVDMRDEEAWVADEAQLARSS